MPSPRNWPRSKRCDIAPPRRRLDAELVRRGLAASRTEARAAIETGLVTVDGGPAFKAATLVHPGQALALARPPRRYVSRGGEKLAYGLDRFGVDPRDRHGLDAGLSTGGFTDCLLQRGARRVIGVDVGYGQVHERIRTDPRVVVLERTNARDLDPGMLPPPPPDLVVADVSFISLTLVLPALRRVAAADAEAVVLVKPQFEAGRDEVGRGGVVRDPAVWAQALRRVCDASTAVGWYPRAAVPSPLRGPAGNVEFLLHLDPGEPAPADPIPGAVAAASAPAPSDPGR